MIQFIFENASYAHWIIFGSLMLAGINIPISEDLMIILSAVIAATVIPENTYILLIAVFLGCYLSDWLCYWIGRHFGPKLSNIPWFKKTLHPKRMEKVRAYYAKYGFWTLLIGRFIPFGVRNALFLTAGAGKMPFGRFVLSDGIACLISNTCLFSLAYNVGKNYETLISYLKTFNILLFSLFVVAVIGFIWYKRRKNAAA